jgi:hypothetical protein
MRWTHVALEPDWQPITWREFETANTLMNDELPHWTDRVKHQLNRQGWCACDAGNGGKTIVLATDRRGVRIVELQRFPLAAYRQLPPGRHRTANVAGASGLGRSKIGHVTET